MGLTLIFIYLLLSHICNNAKWFKLNLLPNFVLTQILCLRSDKREELHFEWNGWREHRVEWLGRCPDSQLVLVKWWSGRGGSKYWELSLTGRSGPVPACGMCWKKRNTAQWWCCYCCSCCFCGAIPHKLPPPFLYGILKRANHPPFYYKRMVDVGRWHHRDRCASFLPATLWDCVIWKIYIFQIAGAKNL